MRHELWRAILAARGDVDKLVAAAVGDYPNHAPARAKVVRPPPRVGGPQLVRHATETAGGANPAAAMVVEHDTLQRLHHDVHGRVEALRAVLAREPGGEQAMLALVLYVDERVMDQLPEFLATSWPLLQTRLTGRKTGGSDFFRLIDRMLEAEPPPELVFEVYFFCLANGFQGQYADDLAALERYQQRLRERIVAPEPQRQPRELAVPSASPRPIRSTVLYYLAAVGAVVLVGFALTVWSNL
jgi:type IV/VI secretion system ImpK/VasF family protein